MSWPVFLANLIAIALLEVVVFGGLLGGLRIGLFALMHRRGMIDRSRRDHAHRISGAVLLGLGVLVLLGGVSGLAGYGPAAAPVGTWASTLAGPILIAVGRWVMLRFRARRRP